MTPSNPPSRTPSRATDSPRQLNPPGVLAISSAMLANANQSQNGQSASTSSKRSKSVTQRRAQNASNTSLFDPQSPAASPMASKEDSIQPASALTAALAQDSPTAPADSPSKRTQSRRRAKAPQSASDADEGGEVVGGQLLDAPSVRTTKASRPRQGRGTSSINMASTSAAQGGNLDGISNDPQEALDPLQLSRSAPASSFLDNVQQSRKRNDKQAANASNNLQKGDNHQTNHLTPRGSNSADEWEMPSARTGNDSLTWQQQAALSSKSSQGKKSNNNKINNDNNQYKKQAAIPVQRVTPLSATTPAPRSGLSNVMAVGASNEPAPALSSLTWQQAQLQRSAPATPSASILFEALEDGYSGARPASDHSRTRSSPVKNSRPITRSQQQNLPLKPALDDKQEVDLDKQLNDLVLSSAKPKTPVQPQSGKKTKPIPIKAPTPVESDSTRSAAMQSTFAASPSVPKSIQMSAGSVSPTKSALYAGPKFHNSPHAGQLPTPRLAAFMNRNRDSSPATPSPPNAGAIFA